MKIQKFQASTYEEAVLKAKIEMGDDILVWQKKIVKTGGFFGFFAQENIEILVSNKKNMAPSAQPQAMKKPILPAPVARNINPKVYDNRENQPRIMPEKSIVSEKMLPQDYNHLKKEREEIYQDISILRQDIKSLMTYAKNINFDQEKSSIQKVKNYLKDMEMHSSHIAMLTDGIENEIPPEMLINQCFIRRKIRHILSQKIKIDNELVLDKKPKIIALAGPTGVGKTVSIAKLATNYSLKFDNDVAMITLDTYKLGATEQLKSYGEVIDVPAEIAFSADEFRSLVDKHKDKQLILVDTAGKSQRNFKDIQELKQYMDMVPEAEIHLVISALVKYQDMVDIYERFSNIGIDKIAFTKIDECALFGPMLSLLLHSSLPASFMTNGQDVPKDLYFSSSQEIANLLLPDFNSELEF